MQKNDSPSSLRSFTYWTEDAIQTEVQLGQYLDESSVKSSTNNLKYGQLRMLFSNGKPSVETKRVFCSARAWFTSADGRGAVPLWWVPGDTIDSGYALELVAGLAGERQRLSCLVKGLFRALHTGGSCPGVPAGLVLFRWRKGQCHT